MKDHNMYDTEYDERSDASDAFDSIVEDLMNDNSVFTTGSGEYNFSDVMEQVDIDALELVLRELVNNPSASDALATAANIKLSALIHNAAREVATRIFENVVWGGDND